VRTPLAEVVPRYLDPEAVADVQGAIPETTALLARKWDMIFFTGSPPVGKIVHEAPAKNLTPAVLALGGKNPTIVHSSAEPKTAARRIAFTRFINSGHVTTKAGPDYGRVINRTNFDRLVGFMENGKIVAGGESDAEELYIAPTVLVDVPIDSVITQDEVFGPILPVLEIDSVDESRRMNLNDDVVVRLAASVTVSRRRAERSGPADPRQRAHER